jgi:hypothetical protein
MRDLSRAGAIIIAEVSIGNKQESEGHTADSGNKTFSEVMQVRQVLQMRGRGMLGNGRRMVCMDGLGPGRVGNLRGVHGR